MNTGILQLVSKYPFIHKIMVADKIINRNSSESVILQFPKVRVKKPLGTTVLYSNQKRQIAKEKNSGASCFYGVQPCHKLLFTCGKELRSSRRIP